MGATSCHVGIWQGIYALALWRHARSAMQILENYITLVEAYTIFSWIRNALGYPAEEHHPLACHQLHRGTTEGIVGRVTARCDDHG